MEIDCARARLAEHGGPVLTRLKQVFLLIPRDHATESVFQCDLRPVAELIPGLVYFEFAVLRKKSHPTPVKYWFNPNYLADDFACPAEIIDRPDRKCATAAASLPELKLST